MLRSQKAHSGVSFDDTLLNFGLWGHARSHILLDTNGQADKQSVYIDELNMNNV